VRTAALPRIWRRHKDTRTDQAARHEVVALLQDIGAAMMATRGEDGLTHARPMATSMTAFEGDLWFFTDNQSPKIAEIGGDPEALLTYANESKQHYVCVQGQAEVVRDRAKIAELWSEPLRVWFPKGKDDPGIALIKVHVETAEFWDSPSSTAVYLCGYARALATGRRPDPGESATVRF
jgi:general stress protein 26